MFSSQLLTNMTCGLKIDTQSPGWQKAINKVLSQFKGVNYSIDVEAGMAYISGRVDPNKLLEKIAKAGKHADLCWVQAGTQNYSFNGTNSYSQYGNYGIANSHGQYGNHGVYDQYRHSHPRTSSAYTTTYYHPRQRQHYYGYAPYGYRYPTWA